MSYAKRKHLAPGFNYFVGDHYRILLFTYICAAQLSVKPNKGIAMTNQLTFLCIYSGTTSLNGFIISRIFPPFSIHTLFRKRPSKTRFQPRKLSHRQHESFIVWKRWFFSPLWLAVHTNPVNGHPGPENVFFS